MEIEMLNLMMQIHQTKKSTMTSEGKGLLI